MIHYIYRIDHNNGKFYIGRHSSKKLDDGYMGSGKWTKSIKDKSSLSKTILEFCDNHQELLKKEQHYIGLYLKDNNNMNFTDKPVGFGSGEYNPCHNPDVKAKTIKRMLEQNPMQNPASRDKMKVSLKGKLPWNTGKSMNDGFKIAVSKGRTGCTLSDKDKAKMSARLKDDYAVGKRVKPNNLTTTGYVYSKESRAKMSLAKLGKKRSPEAIQKQKETIARKVVQNDKIK
jgi:hypothetical protein